MSRLIIEAVSNQKTNYSLGEKLLILVSVSKAHDGKPIIGLKETNFKISRSPATSAYNVKVDMVIEVPWGLPNDNEATGFYELVIAQIPSGEWTNNEIYCFGIQVIDFKNSIPISFGQTVVIVQNVGT